jgi:SAM-dependent methyltransferase
MDKQTQKELQEKVKSSYEDIAGNYSETRKRYLSQFWEELKKIVESVPAGAKVLDVGCGNGWLLDVFGDARIDYIGVDQSEGLLKEARSLHPGYIFRSADILELSQVPEYDFDRVFSVAVLHHLPGSNLRLAALKQMKSKIKPEGKIIITVWNMWSPKWQKKGFKKMLLKYALLKLIGKNRMDFGDIIFPWKNGKGEVLGQRYYHAFTGRELRSLAREAGLKIQRVYKDAFNYYLVAGK